MRGHTNLYERVPKYTTVSFGMRELCPHMKSDSAATADAVAVIRFLDPRYEGRFDTAILLKMKE